MIYMMRIMPMACFGSLSVHGLVESLIREIVDGLPNASINIST